MKKIFNLKGLFTSPFSLLISKTPKFVLYGVFNRRYSFILPHYKNAIQGDSERFRGIITLYSIIHYTGRTYEYMNICTYVHIYRSNICSIEHQSVYRTYVRFRLQYIDRTYVRSNIRTYIEHTFDTQEFRLHVFVFVILHKQQYSIIQQPKMAYLCGFRLLQSKEYLTYIAIYGIIEMKVRGLSELYCTYCTYDYTISTK